MKKLITATLILLSTNSFALLSQASFPETTGQINLITEGREGLDIDNLRMTYLVSCIGHKTASLSGYDHGMTLTNCADDNVEYDIGIRENGEFDLPSIKEFSLEGAEFRCYLSVEAHGFKNSRGFDIAEYITIPCDGATRDEINTALDDLDNLEVDFSK